MYYVYILISLKNGRYYIGQTRNIDERLKRHNSGRVRSTMPYIPWELVYSESFNSRNEACKRELEIKSYKSGILFKKLLNHGEVAERLKAAGC